MKQSSLRNSVMFKNVKVILKPKCLRATAPYRKHNHNFSNGQESRIIREVSHKIELSYLSLSFLYLIFLIVHFRTLTFLVH